jgi:hypothetical protein
MRDPRRRVKEAPMKTRVRILWLAVFAFGIATALGEAQELGSGFTKVKDGIYVYAAKPGNST